MLMGWQGWTFLRAIQWESVLLRRLLCPLLKHSVPQESVVAALQHGVMLPWNPGPGRNQRSTAVEKRAIKKSR